jgi:hypothetical protein
MMTLEDPPFVQTSVRVIDIQKDDRNMSQKKVLSTIHHRRFQPVIRIVRIVLHHLIAVHDPEVMVRVTSALASHKPAYLVHKTSQT